MKYSKDGIAVPERCPYCRSRLIVIGSYAVGDGEFERYVECEGCYSVIGDIDEKRKVAIMKNGKTPEQNSKLYGRKTRS